ncbi:MAG: alpha/beta fold hydrolase [Planctomycetes bacterium]|nr:alpha/beta fold hydrolase [Planctomycetota bacterium]
MIARIATLVVLVGMVRSGYCDERQYSPPKEVRAAFRKLLDRPRVPLDVQLVSRVAKDGIVVERLRFTSEKKPDGSVERVPVYIARPEKAEGKLPAVIVLHGTGGTGTAMMPFMSELCRRGMIGVAIDARYHGERVGGKKGAQAYHDAITRAWRTRAGERHEHPFFYDTCWDLWRTVDYLETRADFDSGRLGMIGFSMGGIQAWMAAAVDERVRVTVPAIAVQSFRWSLDNERWHGRARTIQPVNQVAAKDLGEPQVNQKVIRAVWAKLLPGVLHEFDCPSMIRLFAGRPLLIVSGEKDGNCPLPGAQLAFAQAEKAYMQAGCPEKLRIDVAAGVGHQVTPMQRDAALNWFVRWLK